MVFGPRSRPSLRSWNDGMPRTATPFISYSPGPAMTVGAPARAPVFAWSKWPCVTRVISVWNRGGVRPISFAKGSVAMTASRVSIRKQDWPYQVMVMRVIPAFLRRGFGWRTAFYGGAKGRRSGALAVPHRPYRSIVSNWRKAASDAVICLSRIPRRFAAGAHGDKQSSSCKFYPGCYSCLYVRRENRLLRAYGRDAGVPATHAISVAGEALRDRQRVWKKIRSTFRLLS